MQIFNLCQTCDACPSQWEGSLEDGRMIYIRYRWGTLRASVSPEPTENVGDAVRGETLFTKSIGDDFDGFLSTDDMLKHTGFFRG